jgi:hypothetical protein
MPQPKTGSVERAAGFAGRFIVYYRRNGKIYWDAMFAPTKEQAESDFLAMASEIGWKVEIDRVEERETGEGVS